MALKQIPNSLQSPDGSYYVTLTDGAGNLVTAGGSSGIVAGTTTVTPTSGTQGVLFNNNGAVGSDSGFTYAGSGGVISTTGSFNIPATTATTVGTITQGGVPIFSSFGTSNTFLGTAGNVTVSGSNNLGMGTSAGAALSSGSNNTFIGNGAGSHITTTANNVAIGNNALPLAVTCGTNISIGASSLAVLVGSNFQNVAVGHTALNTLTGASGNTALGYFSGSGLISGANNVFIGNWNATTTGVTTGAGNVFIGPSTGFATGLANSIVLANGIGTQVLTYNTPTAGSIKFAAPAILNSYTVATLPASPGTGAIAQVSDQLTTPAAKGVAPTGGGAVVCVVYYDGAGWKGI